MQQIFSSGMIKKNWLRIVKRTVKINDNMNAKVMFSYCDNKLEGKGKTMTV